MRGGVVILLLGVTALGAYSIGRQDAPVAYPPVPSAPSQTVAPATPLAMTDGPVIVMQPKPPTTPASGVGDSAPVNKINVPDKTLPPAPKRNVEAALTAAAIASILIKTSRDQYHATGKPCACPDDVKRNGRACGARSAYSRPGGAAPICYPHDVTTAMIDAYRQRVMSR